VSGTALGFVTVIVPMDVPLSATTAGEKLLVMTADAACANADAANETLMSRVRRIGRHDDF
jgi:hypothetical protein